jgi:hypothetical protein
MGIRPNERVMAMPVKNFGVMAVLATSLLLSASVSAQSKTAVTELHAFDSEGGKMIVAISASGVTFIDGKEGKTFRAFKTNRTQMKGATTDWIVVRDVDSNGTVDIVGAGRPAFIVQSDGAPVYSMAKGCSQFHLADFDADSAADIACRDGNTIKMLTYNGQKLWEYKVAGLKLGVCNFGDVNGDIKADIECEVLGKGTYVRIGGDGAELGRDYDSAQLDAAEDDNPGNKAAMANLIKGKETFDLDGDGTAEEWVKLDGSAIVVSSKSKPKGLGRHEIGSAYSVLVDDIDGDSKNELVIGGDGRVLIIDDEGKLVADLKVDPNKLKRTADVRIDQVNANALKDASDEAVKGSLAKSQGKFSACYAGNVKKNPFTRVGRGIYSLSVDKKGKVSKVERLHSDLQDKKVDGCVQKALKSAKFSEGTAPDASVTVTLMFGFLDR